MAEQKVRWEEMFPEELQAALAETPLVYMPYGLCEPHGPHNAIGLDAIKAHELCLRAARVHGGIVAPPFYWHIHETGYHAPWGEESIGSDNPFMTSLPPWVMLKLFLYQLRAVAARGFHAAIVVTGHYGGNENDLRLAVELFSQHAAMRAAAYSDGELIDYRDYHGDHAGIIETSQLMALRPDLVEMERLTRERVDNHYYAAGRTAPESTAELGEAIVQSQIRRLGEVGKALLASYDGPQNPASLSFDETERIWEALEARREEWVTLKLWGSQQPVGPASSWFANQSPDWKGER